MGKKKIKKPEKPDSGKSGTSFMICRITEGGSFEPVLKGFQDTKACERAIKEGRIGDTEGTFAIVHLKKIVKVKVKTVVKVSMEEA